MAEAIRSIGRALAEIERDGQRFSVHFKDVCEIVGIWFDCAHHLKRLRMSDNVRGAEYFDQGGIGTC